MEQVEQVADEISKAYLKASRYLNLEMDEIFERFMHKHKLSEDEARRLLASLKDSTSLGELKEALRTASADQTKAELLAELESPAYQARLERLQQTQNELDLVMNNVYQQEKVISTSHYVDLANEAYYRSIFDIQQRTGFGFSFSAIDPKVIDRVINSKWSGANYSDRIWHNTQALARDVKEELLINLLTGRTEREAAEIIANKFGQGASNARRLVRTESCNLATQMDMKSYEECDIETYIFVATLDLKTSSACRELDGKRFPVDEQQPGKNCPPMHPWCRSTTICDISDEELAQMQRRARDPVTGKTHLVPADMSYEEWYKKYVDVNSDEAVAKGSGSGIIKSGAISGARNPYGDAAKAHAEKYYGLVRSMKTDVSKISAATGYSEEQIQEIKNFIFLEKHDLGGPEPEHFAPDYMMAESWRRLIDGKPEGHDLTLLRHEIMEKELIQKGYSQDDAHRQTSAKYNYDKEATEFYGKIEKYKKE